MINLLRRTITQYVEVDPLMITESTDLINDLHLNSYEIVSIVGSVESDLGIEIPEADIRLMKTVGDVLDYIKDKV